MLVLKPMNQDIYNSYIQNAIRQYAEEGAKSGRNTQNWLKENGYDW